MLSMVLVPVASFAASINASVTTDILGQGQKCNLSNIKSRGAAEITRRLTTLGTLQSKINSATHLTSSDAAYLSAEVSSEVSGLTTLQAKLAADTSCATAKVDAQNIINDYRVYALVVPKVELVKTADDQQTTEGKIASLSTELQARITADQNNGKNVATLQADLNNLNTQNSNALKISSDIEAVVLPLQPTDYNNDHSILAGDYAQLKTAHGDLVTARDEAKSIISGLKSLE
jgi:ATP-dependent protease HslVU (ClpYQ) ATPase subunit